MGAAESFILEDIAGCEGVQQAVRSSRFVVGPLAREHERPIVYFQQHLLDALAAGARLRCCPSCSSACGSVSPSRWTTASPASTEDVVWIQGHETFADIRLPREGGTTPIEAFGGTTTWDGKALRWDHELDWHGAFAETDHGRIEWVDDVMVERGTMAVTGHDGDRTELSYEEIWRRECSATAVVSSGVTALGADGPGARALHVEVAGWSITLASAGPGMFAARLVRPDGPTVQVGEGGLAVPEPTDPSWRWVCRDVPADEPVAADGGRP